MRAYALICTGLYLVSLVFGFAAVASGDFGVHLLGMALFPLPVAYYWAQGVQQRSLGLLGVAALAGFTSTGSLVAAVFYVVVASVGVVMGHGIHRRWPFGRCAAASTAVVFALLSANLLWNWDQAQNDMTVWLSARSAEFADAAQGRDAEQAEAFIEQFTWLDKNSAYVMVGSLFGGALLGVTWSLAFLTGLLRRRSPETGPKDSFRTMRPPEWLVWVAILVALVCFADQRWDREALRLAGWNAAVGLSFVYWLNGFSILVYGVNAFKVSPLLFYVIVAALFLLQAHALLFVFGLFDTWWVFRARLDRLAALRRAKQRAEGGDC